LAENKLATWDHDMDIVIIHPFGYDTDFSEMAVRVA
jgi:hypothetical protein